MMESETFFEKTARLDDAAKGDPRSAIDDITELLQEDSLRSYFFGRLDDPRWLAPLRERGFFEEPPRPVTVEGKVRFPAWPEGQFLARVAAVAPESVLDIALRVPETGNVRVHEDLANAALAMPPELSARLVPKAELWLEFADQPLIPNILGKLLGHLTEGGQVDAALGLAKALLAVQAEERTAGGFTFTELSPRFDVWDYQQILKENVPQLVSAVGERALCLMCDILEDAAHISRRDYYSDSSEEHPYEDNFYVQRPAIEDHPQNEPYGLIDALITAVRDTAERLIVEDRAPVRILVGLLERRGWQIFDRLALFLLWRFPEAAPGLVAERLTDRRRFDDPGLRHEYAHLARRCFATLDASDQQTILSWIDDGPDLERFRTGRAELQEEPPTEQQELQYADRWRRDRLALLGDDLPEDWRRRYEELVHTLGETEHPEFSSYTSPMRVGPTSPLTPEDLRSWNVDRILRYLRSWEPSGEFMTPSEEGLGRELAGVVTSDPEPFAAASLRFRALDPTYVRALLNGLRDATKQGQVFSWSPVLSLCQWIVGQPLEIQGRKQEREADVALHDLDPDWGWTRKAIAELLSQGLATETGARLSYWLRSRVWEVLVPLTDDEDPTPEHEERYGGSNMDPATLSINTTRGEAMHAVVRYAIWVREEKEAISEGRNVTHWFDRMPEVREVLDRHLDPELEPSAAIRTVYGRWFPYLVWLDEEWATHSKVRIFPVEESLRKLQAAAWGAFLAFTRPHLETFNVLRREYGRAVDLLGESPSGRWMSAHPDERLAEHLMVLYWWGTLDLEGADNLLPRFFMNAPGDLRARALDFVGISLHRAGDVPPDTLDRLKELWNRRLHPLYGEPPLSAKEAAAFGWWFASANFDDVWSMRQLKEALTRTNDVEAYDAVLERLAVLSEAMPADTVECLKLVLERDTEGWRIFTFRDAQRRILRAALQSGDPSARVIAEDLINWLGVRGQWDLGDLLREVENGTTR